MGAQQEKSRREFMVESSFDNSRYRITVTADERSLIYRILKLQDDFGGQGVDEEQVTKFVKGEGSNELNISAEFNLRIYRQGRNTIIIGLHPMYVTETSHQSDQSRKETLRKRDQNYYQKLKNLF